MKAPQIIRTTLVAGALVLSTFAAAADAVNSSVVPTQGQALKFQQIRNATIKLDYAGTTFLIDPMLAVKGAYKGFEGTPRSHLRNPLVVLPMPVSEVIKADAVILTHLHDDHWDHAARNLIPRNMPIFTQNQQDASKVREDGFTDVRVLAEQGTDFKGTRLYKTGGQHGSDKMYATPGLRELLGEAMGIVFQRPGFKTAYVVGDTIWRTEVDSALSRFKPDVIFLNTGYAQVLGFEGSIIMGKEDMLRAYQMMPQARIVGIHMDTVNHAMLTRAELRAFIKEKKMDTQRALVPEDGDAYSF